jgi:tetratricopeptide (TPR) repeat protein
MFEQYKDALRRGHVALLGGELEDALVAYHEAAGLVPERPLPHASIGTVLARLGRLEEAAAAFDRALEVAPDDDATLRARAEALGASTTEPPTRAPDSPPTSPPGRAPVEAGPDEPEALPPGDAPAPAPPAEADPVVLRAEADRFLDAGDPAAAREPLLRAMAAHRAVGRLDAALDECLQLLSIAPDDPRVHLAIADLELDHGWRAIAAEKVELLLRLTALSGDARAESDVRRLAAARLGAEVAAGVEPAVGGARGS